MGNCEVCGEFGKNSFNKTGDTRIKTVKHLIIFPNSWYFKVCKVLSPRFDLFPVPQGGTLPFSRRGHTLSAARFGDGIALCVNYTVLVTLSAPKTVSFLRTESHLLFHGSPNE